MTQVQSDTTSASEADLYERLTAAELMPLWRATRRLNTATPQPAALPWMWRWSEIEPLTRQAGEEVPITRGGDRRVLVLANPGLAGMPFASPTLWGGIQALGPHESAPRHRHAANAIRFVMTGGGVFTTVDDERLEMSEGDMILTPNWSWHEHENTTDQPMTWFDGLDLPSVVALDATFFERPDDSSDPYEHPDTSMFASQRRFPWSEMELLLDAEVEQSTDQWVQVAYTEPQTGRAVTPTMGCEAHRVTPGGRSATRRKTGSSVYVAHRGHGSVVIDGQSFEFGPGDCFVTPSWSPVDFTAAEQVDLFAISDRPLLEALALFREQILPAASQPIDR